MCKAPVRVQSRTELCWVPQQQHFNPCALPCYSLATTIKARWWASKSNFGLKVATFFGTVEFFPFLATSSSKYVRILHNLFYVIFGSTFFKKLGLLLSPKLSIFWIFRRFWGWLQYILPQFLFDHKPGGPTLDSLPISNFFSAKYYIW